MPRVEVIDNEVPVLYQKLDLRVGEDFFGRGACQRCEAHDHCAPRLDSISKIIGANGFPRHIVIEGRLMEKQNEHCALLR